MNAQEFVQAYLKAEYDLWVMAHTDRDDDRFFAAAETFDATYFGPDVYSDLSRPRGMDEARFQAFSGLLPMKRQRPVYCVTEAGDGVSMAVLGSVDEASTQRFELIRIREVDGEPRIVSSYLTNFDGTFSWNAGEDAGENLPDPCAPSAT